MVRRSAGLGTVMTDLWSRRPAEVAEDPTAEDRRFNYMVEQAILAQSKGIGPPRGHHCDTIGASASQEKAN